MDLGDKMDFGAISSAYSSIVYPVSIDVPRPSPSENGTDSDKMPASDDDMLVDSPRSTSKQTQVPSLRADGKDSDGAQATHNGDSVADSESPASKTRLGSSRDKEDSDDEMWATPTGSPAITSSQHGQDLYDQTDSNDSIAALTDLSTRLRFEVRIPGMPADRREQYHDLDSGVVGMITEKSVLGGGSIEYRVEFTDGRDGMVRRALIF
jgi:hypothetical protein